MIIRDVSVKLVEAPLSRVFRGSTYQVPSRCTVIVRLESDDGVVGEIYSGDERTDYRQIRELILGEFREAYIGEDPLAVERIWDRMFRLTPYIANKAVAMQAISAIDWQFGTLLARPWIRRCIDCWGDASRRYQLSDTPILKTERTRPPKRNWSFPRRSRVTPGPS